MQFVDRCCAITYSMVDEAATVGIGESVKPAQSSSAAEWTWFIARMWSSAERTLGLSAPVASIEQLAGHVPDVGRRRGGVCGKNVGTCRPLHVLLVIVSFSSPSRVLYGPRTFDSTPPTIVPQ